MTIKRAVFVTTWAAETYHQGTIGFARAVRHVRPDLLLDSRRIRRYNFGDLSRASALALEPGMRLAIPGEGRSWLYEDGRLQAEPPRDHEGAWHVIVMVDDSPTVSDTLSSWSDAGWEVFRFDPCWDYPHPLRTSTPTEDRSNPVAVDSKIEGLR